jgi:hypothetical protein
VCCWTGFRAGCLVALPHLLVESVDEESGARFDGLGRPTKGRGGNSIQHTKLLIVRHAALNDGGKQTAGAHLRVHVMTCNIDNVLGRKGCGDLIWRSPVLPALPNVDPTLVLPDSCGISIMRSKRRACSGCPPSLTCFASVPIMAVGLRFGAPLYKLLYAMTYKAVQKAEQGGSDGDRGKAGPKAESGGSDSATRLREWSRMLATYDLAAVPHDVHLVFSMPGTYPASRASADDDVLWLGSLGGRLQCWEYDAQMARNLEAIVCTLPRLYGMDEGGPYLFEHDPSQPGRRLIHSTALGPTH